MRKILSFLAIITLCGITSINVVACHKAEDPIFPSKKIELDTIILEKDLGTIRFTDILVPTRSELLIAIKNKNPNTTKFLMENDFGFKKGSTDYNCWKK
ncbi:hypothetical protein [Spiroplasma endosymbiont of Polydrusus pterygomalis]|uniref:hypothetical protein n=1 Tax=Spiroplasma endosymbiont of Polydrusus pterygomalis TaxID=3139327 RepID=UPI003CCA8894